MKLMLALALVAAVACVPAASAAPKPVANATATANAGPPASVARYFTDVAGAAGHRYDLQDDTGKQMACTHVVPGTHAPYVALSHAQVGSEFEVRLATSDDLLSWTFGHAVLPNADMPYPFTVAANGWVVVVHEQWMNAGSQLPSRLGFKLWYNASDLAAGAPPFNSFLAPLTVGAHSQLEGTPNVYGASMVTRQGLQTLDLVVGFHYNDRDGVDQVAQGALTSFGPASLTPSWAARAATAYDQKFIAAGAIGNIGQRDAGALDGVDFVLQEGNVGHMPPTIWADWRVWLYVRAPGEPLPPTGAGTPYQLAVRTDKGSTAFGNPSVVVLQCPGGRDGGQCVFVSYFIFGEGAAPGEAGNLVFYHRL